MIPEEQEANQIKAIMTKNTTPTSPIMLDDSEEESKEDDSFDFGEESSLVSHKK